jgi:uncharacterized membrane protein YkvA (DUF1232 family)
MGKSGSGILGEFKDLLHLPQMLRLFAALLPDPRVSLWLKIGVTAGAVYVLSPLDIIPDVITGIGIVDDILIAFLILQGFIGMAPQDVVDEHCARLGIKPEDVEIDLRSIVRNSVGILAPLIDMRQNANEARRSADTRPSNGAPAAQGDIPAGANPRYSIYKESQD